MAISLARVFKGLCRLSAKKRLGAQAIRDGHLPVRAGLWLVGPSFSRRWGIRLPPPLNTVKQWYNFRPVKALRSPIKLSGIIIPPWFARVGAGRPASRYSADVVLVNRAMELVGFDLDERIVMRRSSPSESQRLMSLVDNLRPIYSCPRLVADPHGEFLFEELVLGDPFSRVSATDRARCVAAILEALAKTTAIALSDGLSEQLRALCDRLLADLPAHVRRPIEEELTAIIGGSTTGWIHGDLSGENIIFRDSQWFVIDFDQVTVGPVFFDIVSLFINEAGWGRGELLGAFSRGCHDAALVALGVPADKTDAAAWRVGLCVATLGWWCLRGEMSERNAKLRLNELLKGHDLTPSRYGQGTAPAAKLAAPARGRPSPGGTQP